MLRVLGWMFVGALVLLGLVFFWASFLAGPAESGEPTWGQHATAIVVGGMSWVLALLVGDQLRTIWGERAISSRARIGRAALFFLAGLVLVASLGVMVKSSSDHGGSPQSSTFFLLPIVYFLVEGAYRLGRPRRDDAFQPSLYNRAMFLLSRVIMIAMWIILLTSLAGQKDGASAIEHFKLLRGGFIAELFCLSALLWALKQMRSPLRLRIHADFAADAGGNG